jgi:hypothetical protein
VADPYRITEPSSAPRPKPAVTTRGALRPLLWLLLMVSVAVNAASSAADVNIAVGVTSGLIVLACAAGLIVDHYRRRR